VPDAVDNLGEGREAPPVANGPRSMPGRIPVTAEQRDHILKDPLVQQTLELFEGAIVNMEREVPAAAAEAEETEEPTE